MELKNVKIDFAGTYGELLMIGEPTLVYGFVDGKKTDVVDGFNVPLVSTKTWDKIQMKIKDKNMNLKYEGNPIPIILKNPQAKMWQDFNTKEVKISCSADAIAVMKEK